MNAKAKGARNERRSRRLPQAPGYLAPERGSLGVWSLIGVQSADVVLVQVKTGRRPGTGTRGPYLYLEADTPLASLPARTWSEGGWLAMTVSGQAPGSAGMEGLVTLDEAAKLLSCTPAALRKWIGQGRLVRVKLGRLTRVRRSDLLAIVRNGLAPCGRVLGQGTA
jgi:excisionase family DNA binding protein